MTDGLTKADADLLCGGGELARLRAENERLAAVVELVANGWLNVPNANVPDWVAKARAVLAGRGE